MRNFLRFDEYDGTPITPVDASGHTLKIQDLVVYNRSGKLELGVVREIRLFGYKRGSTGYYLKADIRIQHLDDKKMSRIKHPRSIYNIEQFI